jgi:SAM-dependent methyltransferase
VSEGIRRALLAGLLGAAAASGACRRDGDSALPQHYDDKQAALAQFDDPERDAWALPDRVVQALPIDSPSLVIADIGAGSGYFTRRLARRVPEGKVYAVDVDAEFKQWIEGHKAGWGTPNVEPRLALYENPLLPAAAVDLVFVSNTYAFIRDRVGYFRAVRAALRPGGRLAVIEFREDARCEGVAACPGAQQRVPRARAIEELGQAGFAVDAEHDFLPHQYFLVLRTEP